MYIYGAGMAGLLAGQMLRRYGPIIRERLPKLPDNHGALLRFRSDAVARVTGIPLRRVTVTKAVCLGEGDIRSTATLREHNMYSDKVLGEIAERSILDLSPSVRYVAPDNFIELLSRGLQIEYEHEMAVTEPLTEAVVEIATPIISTIPMPALMKIVGWPNPPTFRWREIWSVRARIVEPRTDVFQTIYYPDANDQRYYRASISGSTLIIEYLEEPEDAVIEHHIELVLDDFGIQLGCNDIPEYEVKHQQYGKLLPIDERTRRQFIVAMTDRYRIYSVGRFATWRQILMDDVVQDVTRVAEMIEMRDGYSRRLLAKL